MEANFHHNRSKNQEEGRFLTKLTKAQRKKNKEEKYNHGVHGEHGVLTRFLPLPP
jgi:hypothetical protein